MLLKSVAKDMYTNDFPNNYNKKKDYHEEEAGGEEQQDATVKLDRNTYNRLKIIVKKKEKDIKNTINSIVRDYVQKEILFELYRPMLYIVTIKDASMFVKDEKVNKLVEVVLRYKDQKSNDIIIWCNDCKSEYCIHTAFALASNELGQLQLKIRNNSNHRK